MTNIIQLLFIDTYTRDTYHNNSLNCGLSKHKNKKEKGKIYCEHNKPNSCHNYSENDNPSFKTESSKTPT